MISARPPPPLSSSVDVVTKRFRSGSISSRLRSASELLDDGVIENRQQKGVLKDLIIGGDEKLLEALSRYERGDKEPIKSLLRDGVLNRKSSLDLLGDVGDLNFDFLSVSATSFPTLRPNIDAPFPMDEEEMTFEILLQDSEAALGRSPPKRFLAPGVVPPRKTSFSLPPTRYAMGGRSASLSSIGSFSKPKQTLTSKNSFSGSLIGTPPPDLLEMHLLDETGLGVWAHPALRGGSGGGGSYSRREILDFDSEDLESLSASPKERMSPLLKPVAAPPTPVPPKSSRRQSTPKTQQNVAGSAMATSAPIVIPRPAKVSGSGRQSSTGSTKRSAALAASTTLANAQTSTVPSEERVAIRRAQGVIMVGAYSPDSRRQRVDRFVAKRDRRVWKKKVKYDVRKNFADSRLRVKGRFVKKEDEEMLRDLMTMV